MADNEHPEPIKKRRLELAAKSEAMGKTERCESCLFYRETPNKLWGRCHRFPQHAIQNDRPQVEPHDWCGEYESGDHPHNIHERNVAHKIEKSKESSKEK